MMAARIVYGYLAALCGWPWQDSVQVPCPGAVRVQVGFALVTLVSKLTSICAPEECGEWHVSHEAPSCICWACSGNVLELLITTLKSWHLLHSMKLFTL